MKLRNLLSGLFYRVKNTPGLFRRFKFWILLALFLLLLAALGPWVDLLSNILKGIGSVLRPIVDNKVGRFVLVNAILVLVGMFLYRRFRERGRRLLGAWAVDRFLAGLLHLSGGRYRRAASKFEGVLRIGRLTNLRQSSVIYPEIAADARIKLALCYRESGEVEKAMKSLELLKVRDLSPTLRKDLAEAKAFVYSLSDKLMDETVDREIAGALDLDPSNRRLLRLRRTRAEKVGDLPVAIAAQTHLVKVVRAGEKGEERGRLAALHARNALRLYHSGELEQANEQISRSRRHDPDLVLPNLIAGDIALERGEVRAAVREWARTPSLPALERVRRLLVEKKLEGPGDLGFLVETMPRGGTLLLLAEHYLAAGKLRKAGNCVRKFDELGLGNRHSAHLHAEILRQEGHLEAAERLDWQALKGFLGADSRTLPTAADSP